MLSSRFNLVTVIPYDMRNVLRLCNLDDSLMDRTSKILYLDGYLRTVNVKTTVIEDEYIDKDFIDDYSAYYSRCFKNYRRKCVRAHLFSKEFSPKQIAEFICGDRDDADELQSNYIGFVILRPLPETVIGRTCLIPYEQGRTGHVYPALCRVSVSFFGKQLYIDCMPFQEQDSNIAACATCAMWSALYVAARKFHVTIHSPSDITTIAVSHGLSTARNFPNRGIRTEDMMYAIRHCGLDPLYIDFQGMEPSLIANKFLGNVYAYVNFGISVIAVVNIVACNGVSQGIHAISINGYHIDHLKGYREADKELVAGRIDKIYANDDQLVPYSRLVVENFNGQFRLKSQRKDVGEIDDYCRFEPINIIVPIYHKIRVSYDEVWDNANELDQMIKMYCKGCIDGGIAWDIALKSSNEYKTQLRDGMLLTSESKLDVLKTPMPRYIWLVRVSLNDTVVSDFCFDATDSGQGLNIVKVIHYYSDLRKILAFINKASASAAFNVFCRAIRNRNGN